MMKSSHLLVSVFLFTLLGSTFSCVELDPDPREFNLAPESFEGANDLELGVIGIYDRLYSLHRMTNFYAPAWAGDDITTYFASNKEVFREFDQRNVTSVNDRLLTSWKDAYNLINAANAVIARAASLEDSEDPTIRRLIGEAYFLRGMTFHQLTRIYGRIPLETGNIPDPNISRSSQTEVYERIEDDFMQAESRLPDVYPNTKAGAPRPNKGSAKAYLARLYLDWAGFPEKDASKYVDAAEKAKEVIDNKTSHGFDLLSDLEDLWVVENKFNQEAVFTISYCASCGDLANRKYGILGLNSEEGGWTETFAEVRFFDDFPEGPRKEATYRNDLVWQTSTDQKSPMFKKVVGPAGDLPAGAFSTDRNDFHMRYAEVLLTYAEASGRSGNVTADAWEALNKIRRRAEGLPFNTASGTVDVTSGDIAELAYTERKWELAGEYLRWSDLVRMERVEEALTRRDQIGTIPIQERNPIVGDLSTANYFSPIPQEIVDINPNLKD